MAKNWIFFVATSLHKKVVKNQINSREREIFYVRDFEKVSNFFRMQNEFYKTVFLKVVKFVEWNWKM